ncbi:MAG: hypothetical protein [Bacteriophage sp.]|nr:MAG: hypothetical protein [Bacteriophage sp.]
MADPVANVVVSMPSQLFTRSDRFSAVANGKIYVGLIDSDPTVPGNQIQAYIENEDGSLTAVPQPLRLNLAGYPVYNGQVVKFVTVQGHSMSILTSNDVQMFYFPNALKYDPDQLRNQLNTEGTPTLVDDSRVGVKQPFTGTVNETQHSFNKIFVNVTSFGAIPSTSADTAVDCTVGLKAALASGASDINVPPGYYLCTESLVVPAGVTLRGSGVGFDKLHPTTILFKGTGAKNYTVTGAVSTSVNNPDAGAAYLADSGTRGDVYRTNDFTSSFSAAVILGEHASLLNIGILPYFLGISGYFDSSNFNLSDAWDVGIWLRNAGGAKVSGCISQGHWRKAGFLQSTHDIGDGKVPACERCHIEFCSFEGLFGASIRAANVATSAVNYGFAGTDFINCYFRGLWHATFHLATSSRLSTPFDRPSGCLEIDGAFNSTGKVRGVEFLNCTFTNRDDIMHMTVNSAETLFSGCYYESQLISVNGASLPDSLGARFVSTNASSALYHKQCSQFGCDTTPYFSIKDISIRTSGRYDPAKSGVFNPGISIFDDWQDVVFGGSIGHRLRNANQTFNINAADGTNVVVMDATGRIKYVTTLESTGTSINLNRTVSGVSTPAIRVYGTGNVQIGAGNAATTFTFDGAAAPYADGSSNMGLAVYRFGTFFGVNGAINTSDATHKTEPRDISTDEVSAFSEIGRLPMVWQWLAKYQIEGDDARLHSGPTVQAAIAIMDKYSLNWSRYSAFCFDKWDDIPDEIDDEGNVARPGRDAGEIYSFRKDELLWWCMRAHFVKFDELEARIKSLEFK